MAKFIYHMAKRGLVGSYSYINNCKIFNGFNNIPEIEKDPIFEKFINLGYITLAINESPTPKETIDLLLKKPEDPDSVDAKSEKQTKSRSNRTRKLKTTKEDDD